jgi:CheY-like chemotaxis protein
MDRNAWILHVEDDPIDAESLRRAFARCGISNPLHRVARAEEALSWLGGHQGGPTLHGIVLLDLGMPGIGGLGFLRHRQSDSELRRVPAVVLTGSNHERDRRLSYELGASGYVVKPIDAEEFVEAVRVIGRYWTLCELT